MTTINKLVEEFEKPSNKFRSKPFWAWNGNLDKNELLRQIDILKEMGFDGYFMHSRVGLQTEYLGKDWFDLINVCADYGESIGMESYLYDEDRWPSGTAGGIVTEKPENRMKFIEMTIGDTYTPVESEIITFACVLTDKGYDSCRVIDNTDRLRAGESVVSFSVVEMTKSNFYNGFTYADTMRRETTDEYISVTHEAYKQNCGDRIGGTIKGVFTDEPNRGSLFSGFSGGGNNRAPFTDMLFDAFKARYGYDLKEKLAELFLVKEIRPVKWHYCEMIQSLFLENFLIPIYEWCGENNMSLTGHVIQEDSLSAQIALQGSLMRSYEYMHEPGIDVLTEWNKNYWIAKQLSSVARQLGKKKCLSELYGCTGWQMNFMSHKNVGDWQALFGINERCHHLSWYTMQGEAKRDYPASILHQSAWYKDYKYVEDYYERLNYALNYGDTEQELLVIYPIESVSSRIYAGCFTGLSAADETMKNIEKMFRAVFMKLVGARIDFDYADEDILARHGSVNGAEIKVGAVAYKRVLVAGMDNIRSSTLSILNKFAKNGGTVILCGDAPSYVDALPNAEFDAIMHKKIRLGELAKAVSCGNEVTGGSDKIFAQTRRIGDARTVILLNIDRDNSFKNQTLKLGEGRGVYELDCRTGKKKAAAYTIYDGYVYVTTDFYPGEEKVYVVCDSEQEKNNINKHKLNEEIIDGMFDYELTAPNICVLDMVRYSIDDSELSEETEILAADRCIRDKCGVQYRGGDMLQPWYAAKKGIFGRQFGKVRLEYEFEIETMPENEIELVSEYPADAEIKINNIPFEAVSCGKWIDICFDRYKIPREMIKPGINTISVTLDFCEATNPEALYLLGDFGVDASCGKRIITKLPEKIGIGDITNSGLPFYSDSIIYKMHSRYGGKLELSKFGGAYAKVGSTVMGFMPYECEVVQGDFELEIVLTRRNTFGPLHQCGENITAYGPANFVTTGEEFSDNYQLVEQGLLACPVVRYKKE